jgi:hypothetical protein
MPLAADVRESVIEDTAERIAGYVIAALRTPEGAETLAGEPRRQGWTVIPPPAPVVHGGSPKKRQRKAVRR